MTSNLSSNLPSPYFPRTPPSTPINVPTPPERTFTALMCTAKSYLDPPAIPLQRHVGERKRSCNKHNKERTFKYTTVPMIESSAKRIRNTYRRCDLTAGNRTIFFLITDFVIHSTHPRAPVHLLQLPRSFWKT